MRTGEVECLYRHAMGIDRFGTTGIVREPDNTNVPDIPSHKEFLSRLEERASALASRPLTPRGRRLMERDASEIDDLTKRGTWVLEALAAGRKAIDGRWVYKIKIGADNKINRFKARYVAEGYAQIPGVDFLARYVIKSSK
jgi:hypothetical protein